MTEQEELHECLLDVQAVFGFVPDDALRAVDHIASHFFTTVCRQAVHEDGVGVGHGHHFGVYTPVGEGLAALFVLGLETHAGPDVGGDQVRATGGFHGIVELAQNIGSNLSGALGVELVAPGRGDVQGETEKLRRLQPSVGHVVGVADPGNGFALNRSTQFNVREDVGQNLARVELIGEPVDYRDPGMRRKAFDTRLLESPDHYDVHHARNDTRCVLDGFGPPQLRIGGGQVYGGPAQLIHAGFKRDACARAGLFEDHGQRAVVQGVVRLITLEFVLDQACTPENVFNFCTREITKLQEVPQGTVLHRVLICV